MKTLLWNVLRVCITSGLLITCAQGEGEQPTQSQQEQPKQEQPKEQQPNNEQPTPEQPKVQQPKQEEVKQPKQEEVEIVYKEQKIGWQIDLKQMSINFSSTTLQNQDLYAISADTRLRGDSQIVAQGILSLNADYYTRNFVVFNSLLAEYGRTVIFPKDSKTIDNKTLDRILLSSDYTQRLWEINEAFGVPKWHFEFGPYSRLSYQTEFVPSTSELGRRQIVRINAGLKLFSGIVLKNFMLTAFGEKDFNPNIETQSFGYEIGLSLDKRLRNTTNLTFMLNFRDYLHNTTLSEYNPKYYLETEVRYNLNLYKKLKIAPFAKLYALQGKNMRVSGNNIMIGVVFSYAQMLREAPFEIVEIK